VSGTLEPGEVGPFLAKLARHSEAFDAERAASVARTIAAMAKPGDRSMRYTTRRDGRVVAVVELNVSRAASGTYSIRIRTNRDVADALEKELGG